MDEPVNDKNPAVAPSGLSAGLAAMRPDFEKWYAENMDNFASFILYCDTEYYDDSDVQKAWRGYQAGVLSMAANV